MTVTRSKVWAGAVSTISEQLGEHSHALGVKLVQSGFTEVDTRQVLLEALLINLCAIVDVQADDGKESYADIYQSLGEILNKRLSPDGDPAYQIGPWECE